MINIFSPSFYFGIVITPFLYYLFFQMDKKFKNTFTSPLLLTTVFIIIILVYLDIPYQKYNESAKYLGWILKIATVCLAIPIYKQINILKKYFKPVLISLFIGSAGSVISVITLCSLIGLDFIIAKSLSAISVTTAISIGIAENVGGIVPLTVCCVVFTGMLGAVFGEVACKLFKIKNPVSKGLAMGSSSHVMGTSKALKMGEVEGAVSSLSIVISGLLTSIIAPVLLKMFN